jgi:Xaa-Pro aminopeptidase
MTTEDLNPYGYCPASSCGCAIIQRDRDPSGSSRCSMGHFTLTRDVHAEPLVQRARAAKLEAERQALRDEGAVAERAVIAEFLAHRGLTREAELVASGAYHRILDGEPA